MHDDNLAILLKELKLGTMVLSYADRAIEADDKNWGHQKYLRVLCDEEISERHNKKIQRFMRESCLPKLKTLDSFNFESAEAINKKEIISLTQNTAWLENNENVLLFGPSGAGKSHIAAAIGYAMIEKGMRVKFMSAVAMIQVLERAKRDLALMDELSKLDKYTLLILDDIGYARKTELETQLLFELIAHRYESGSMMITSNHGFSKWNNIFPDEIMTVAAIDRLIHHAKIISFEGVESYRGKQFKQAAEVV